MNQLTEKQQTIINNITSEFLKINTEYLVPKGSLVDVSPFLQQINMDKIRRKEIEIQNSINQKIILDNIERDAKRLNDDLAHAKILAVLEKYSIRLIAEKDVHKVGSSANYDTLHIHYEFDSNTVWFKSQIEPIGEISTTYYYRLLSAGKFSTIEEVVKTDTFKDKIISFIKSINQ
jgi:hypothetical protein